MRLPTLLLAALLAASAAGGLTLVENREHRWTFHEEDGHYWIILYSRERTYPEYIRLSCEEKDPQISLGIQKQPTSYGSYICGQYCPEICGSQGPEVQPETHQIEVSTDRRPPFTLLARKTCLGTVTNPGSPLPAILLREMQEADILVIKNPRTFPATFSAYSLAWFAQAFRQLKKHCKVPEPSKQE